MKSDGFYTKPIEEFKKKYWDTQIPIKNTISIKDERVKDVVTDANLTDRNRMHSEVDTSIIKRIAEKAREYDIDPYTALAIAFQETQLKDEYSDNPFNLLGGGRLNPETAEQDIMDLTMLTMQDKKKIADKLGKKTEEEVIQAWNGYGKIGKNSFGREVKKVYGIDVSENPIDMAKNPVYGKRVKDIRDNILKKNPEVVKIINSVLSPVRK